MSPIRVGHVATGVAALVAAVAMSACGEAGQSKTVTITKTTTTGQSTTTTASAGKQRPSAGHGKPKRHSPRTTLTACDANVKVKASTTTCGFAESVFYEYWRSVESVDDDALKAYSSALGTYLPVDCELGDQVTCRTDAGALVRFPQSAIDTYTAENAARYAASHQVTNGPPEQNTSETPPSESNPSDNSTKDGGGDCDPSYEGACLDPTAADYDCEGGSGDGPEYTGTVAVVGDDHFDLDRDGDGVGCDS